MPTTPDVTVAGRTRQQRGLPVTVLATGLILLATAAPAQERTPIPLPEVKVDAPYSRPAVPDRATTGTKTDTPLMDIPASIQVVPKEVFAEQGAYSLDAVTRNVSGVSLAAQSAYGFFNNFLVRGLAQQFLRDGLIDGPQINGYARSLTDVERVEVLKGPGSALYGSGQPGGTINLISKPALETPFAALYGTGGSFGTYRFGVDLGGPLGTRELPTRFNGSYYHTDGFRGLSSTALEILPLVTWKPNRENTLTLKFDYRDLEVTPDTYGIPFRGRTILAVPRDTRYYTPFGATDQQVYRAAVSYELRLTDDLLLRNNVAMLRRNLFLLRNAGGTVAPGSLTMTGRVLREQTDATTDWAYQLEPVWKVTTGPVRHTLLGGFEYRLQLLDAKRQTASLPNITNVFNPVVPERSRGGLVFTPNFDRRTEANQYGLYVQDQVELTEQWKARAGLRRDLFDAHDFNRLARPRVTRDDDQLSWQAGLVYQPLKATSFYTGASRSFLFNVSSESGVARAPEEGDQIEIGNKTLLLGDRLSVNTALFHTVRKDFLVTIGADQVPIGEQKTQGFEVDLASEPLSGWKLYANYAYLDAELTKLSPTDPSRGKGHRPVGVPLNSAGLWSTYEIQTGALRGLGFGGGFTYKGSVFLDTLNTQAIPEYAVADLVAFYRRAPFEFQVNVNNVADSTSFITGRNSGAAPGDPLSAYATVQVRY